MGHMIILLIVIRNFKNITNWRQYGVRLETHFLESEHLDPRSRSTIVGKNDIKVLNLGFLISKTKAIT